MKQSNRELARDFAEELILYPTFSAMDVVEFAEERGIPLSDDDLAEVILATNKNMLEARRLWKEHRV